MSLHAASTSGCVKASSLHAAPTTAWVKSKVVAATQMYTDVAAGEEGNDEDATQMYTTDAAGGEGGNGGAGDDDATQRYIQMQTKSSLSYMPLKPFTSTPCR